MFKIVGTILNCQSLNDAEAKSVLETSDIIEFYS